MKFDSAKYPRARGNGRRIHLCELLQALSRSHAALEISPSGCLLVSIVGQMEDELFYSKEVRFFNSDLKARCGFGSHNSLIKARQKAIDGGWLKYKPGGKGVAGAYWTTIPEFARELLASRSKNEPKGNSCHSKNEQKRERNGSANGNHSNPTLSPSPKKVISISDCTFPQTLDTPECRTALADWLEHKRALGNRYKSVKSVELLLRQWADREPAEFKAAVEFSISQNWKGIFPPAGLTNGKAQTRIKSNGDFDHLAVKTV